MNLSHKLAFMSFNNNLIIGNTNSFSITVASQLFEPNGDVRHSSPYNAFLDICTSEGFIGSELEFLKRPNTNTEEGVNYLLGKFAEALIVMKCNDIPEYNHFFAHEARLAQRTNNPFIDRFVAIGTGLQQTRIHPLYNFHCQMNDQQRDIVWVNKRDVKSLLTVPNRSGYIAGLQIKVSSDWRYAYKKIKDYLMPMVYFDLNNDWHQLDATITREKALSWDSGLTDWQHVHLVPQNDIVQEIKSDLLLFRQLLIKLVHNEISVQYIIDMAKYEGNANLGHAITSGFTPNSQIIVSKTALLNCEQILQEELQNNWMNIGFPIQNNVNQVRAW